MGQSRKMFTASPFANSERTHPAEKQMNQPPLPSSTHEDLRESSPGSLWLTSKQCIRLLGRTPAASGSPPHPRSDSGWGSISSSIPDRCFSSSSLNNFKDMIPSSSGNDHCFSKQLCQNVLFLLMQSLDPCKRFLSALILSSGAKQNKALSSSKQ